MAARVTGATFLRHMPVTFRLIILWFALLGSLPAMAQTDEIEVYDASIVAVGRAQLTVHGNYTPDGLKQPSFIGGVTPNHSTNGTFELAYGAADFWELGLYLPVYTVTGQGHAEVDGAKLRTLFVTPNARQREFFYGVNVEYSYNLPHWAPTRTDLEVRTIAGWHEGRWDLMLNPIFDSNFNGLGAMHFAPAERIAYNASDRWAFALEAYADWGPVQRFNALSQQAQSLFVVADWMAGKGDSLEFGAGHGLTAASDRLVLKLIWNHDL